MAGNTGAAASTTGGGGAAASGPGNNPGNPIETAHEDMIHDAQLDYYGKRLATCSSDRTVRVFNVDKSGHAVGEGAVLRGHSGPVWQVAWAHPSFGGILASCSYDGRVFVWKEVAKGGGAVRGGGLRSESGQWNWGVLRVSFLLITTFHSPASFHFVFFLTASTFGYHLLLAQATHRNGKRSRNTCFTRRRSIRFPGLLTSWVPCWLARRATERCRCCRSTVSENISHKERVRTKPLN